MNDAGIKRTGIERRTLLKGAAWSVPVLAAAAAVPAYAASITCSAYSVRGTGFAATGSTFSAQYSLNKAAAAQSLAGWTLVIDLQPMQAGSTLSVTSHVPAGATVSTSAIAGGGTRIQVANITGTSISFGGTFTGGFSGSASWTNGTCATTTVGVAFGTAIPTYTLVLSAGLTGDLGNQTVHSTIQVKNDIAGNFISLQTAKITATPTIGSAVPNTVPANDGGGSVTTVGNGFTIATIPGNIAKFVTKTKPTVRYQLSIVFTPAVPGITNPLVGTINVHD